MSDMKRKPSENKNQEEVEKVVKDKLCLSVELRTHA
jgi:hypothetical protein